MVMSFLTGREPVQADLSVLAEVRAYWQALREGTALPRRDRIDPRGLSGALDRVFLADGIAPGQARLRIAGMRLADLLGMELRGMPLSALFLTTGRARLSEVVQAVSSGGALADLSVETERRAGQAALAGRMLLLPVAAADGAPGLVLGCLALPPARGWRPPGRLAIRIARLEPLEMAGGQAGTALRPALAERGHLRLVHSAG